MLSSGCDKVRRRQADDEVARLRQEVSLLRTLCDGARTGCALSTASCPRWQSLCHCGWAGSLASPVCMGALSFGLRVCAYFTRLHDRCDMIHTEQCSRMIGDD